MKPSLDPAIVLANKSEFQNFTKSQREFVITRFNESLDWIEGLEHLTTVYNKGPLTPKGGPLTPKGGPLTPKGGPLTPKGGPLTPKGEVFDPQTIQVPNVGAGLETMLRHIIDRYDSLAEITMFCQGNLLDRDDQALYPLSWYFEKEARLGVRGFTVEAWDSGTSRFPNRLSNTNCTAIKDRDLARFRQEVVGIPYKPYGESWVRGDWISATREAIRRKPLAYYKHLYAACEFGRGIFTEELWYLERSWYSILTRPLAKNFRY